MVKSEQSFSFVSGCNEGSVGAIETRASLGSTLQSVFVATKSSLCHRGHSSWQRFVHSTISHFGFKVILMSPRPFYLAKVCPLYNQSLLLQSHPYVTAAILLGKGLSTLQSVVVATMLSVCHLGHSTWQRLLSTPQFIKFYN